MEKLEKCNFQFIAQIIKLIEKNFLFFENLKNKIPNKKWTDFTLPQVSILSIQKVLFKN